MNNAVAPLYDVLVWHPNLEQTQMLRLKAATKEMAAQADKDFLEYLIKAIVSHPNEISVERTVDERGVLLTLKTNPEDMGYVIGRQGQTARAIRTLLKIVGAKNNARVNLKIYEPEGSRRPRGRRDESVDIDTDVVDDLKI